MRMAEESTNPPAVPPTPTAPQPPMSPPPTPDPKLTRLVKEWKHSRPLLSCRIDPTGNYACAGGHDRLVLRWKLDNDERLDLTGPQSWVRGLSFQPGGPWLVGGDYSGRLFAWAYATDAAQSPAIAMEAHRGWVRTVAISPDGKSLATAGNDHTLRVWSTDTWQLQVEFVGHECNIYNVRFHPTGDHVASADLKGQVLHWDLSRRQLVRRLDTKHLFKHDEGFRADAGGIRGMSFSPDGKYLVCSGITEITNAFAGVGHAVAVLFDWETGEQKHVLRPKENFIGVGWQAAFHPAGFLAVAVAGNSGSALWFFSPDSPEPIHVLSLPAPPRDLDFHPDGLKLAIAHFDGALRLFEMSPPPA